MTDAKIRMKPPLSYYGEEHVPESANFAREGGDAYPNRANRVHEEAI